VSAPERVRAPRDSRSPPPKLDRDDADAAARSVLADYVRQQQGATRQVAGTRGALRWLMVLGLATLGAGLGALVGVLRGEPIAFGLALAAVGLLLGLATTRR
jgi:hypothetical protein